MKYHLVKNQRPIKYKEFIQQIQNSSRSSLNEPSILSQRSYRESGNVNRSSNKVGENKNIFIDDNSSPQQMKRDDDGEQCREKEFKATRKLVEQQQQHCDNNNNPTKSIQQNDKLYTFCDAKLTQRSVETTNKQNHPLNQQSYHRNQLLQHGKSSNNKQLLRLQQSCHMQKAHSEQKYFRTNKQQKIQQKENINFVNSILARVESMGENKNKGGEREHEEGSFLKVKQNYQPVLNHMACQPLQPTSLCSSQQNTQRKIQSVRKLRVKPSTTQQTTQKQTSHKQPLQSKQKERNPSSKKKIVALNINAKKSTGVVQNNNRVKLKLTMEPTEKEKEKVGCEQGGGSQSKSKLREEQNNSIVENKNILYGSLVSQNPRMKSLQQSKIQATAHDLSNPHLLMSGSSLTDLATFLTKQPLPSPQNQQLHRLHTIINSHIQRQNQLTKQINQLNLKLKSFKGQDDKKELEIIQKDCQRLTTSYKEIKRMYQVEVEARVEMEGKYNGVLVELSALKQQLNALRVQNTKLRQQNTNLIQTTSQLHSQATDLKQCLTYKQSLTKQLQSQLYKLSKTNSQLQQQLSTQHFPPELQGLSQMIKQKIAQYQESIENYVREVEEYREENMGLVEENQNLMVIREKLENFTALLKQQIQDKDALIEDYQCQLRQLSQLRKSIKTDNQHNEFTQTKLKLRIKQLQSKLKLANSHIEYLTKEIIQFKQEREGKQGEEGNAININNQNSRLGDKYETVKSTNLTTIGNSLTTRYSSVTHFDNYPYRDLEDGNAKVAVRERDREDYMEVNQETN